ncbi:hypothetical protein ACFQY9_10500 [Microvirga aerilata]
MGLNDRLGLLGSHRRNAADVLALERLRQFPQRRAVGTWLVEP